MNVPQFDLTRQFELLRAELMPVVESVLAQGNYILGPQVEGFEREMAQYLGVRHTIGVANGTDALLLALKVLGVGPGDEVITTPFTFFASAEVVSQLGARPIFADIDPESLNIAVDRVAKAITDKTKAIIPVHIFGQPADMAELIELALEAEIPIIEDACQAIGAKYNNKMVGSFGMLSCFSFFPTKNLGCVGDGGLVATDDDALAKKIRILRVHGSTRKYFHTAVGWNSRLDEVQAAILRVKLRKLDQWTQVRQAIAERYTRLLGDCKGVTCPKTRDSRTHVFHQYVIRAENRDELKQYLAGRGVGTSIYYPCPLHLQEVYNEFGYTAGSFAYAEAAAMEALALPIYPELKEGEQLYVVEGIKDYYGGRKG